MNIWDNATKSDEELRAKMAQRLLDFRKKIREFEYQIAQMEVMIEDYVDLKDGRTRLE
jgi:hypothetical protein|tara:strand:- start:150 stop:323 length:174 start_codon:yes stop_codon:yes gene_type:complete